MVHGAKPRFPAFRIASGPRENRRANKRLERTAEKRGRSAPQAVRQQKRNCSMTSILSVDLASRRYSDIGVILLERQRRTIRATRVPAFSGNARPTAIEVADVLVDRARVQGAELIILDGPQAWKSADNGLNFARKCEAELATQGKTGLQQITVDGESFDEGSVVTVLVSDEHTFTLTDTEEAALLESIAEADRGELLDANDVLKRLP
jgi:hypothetical protein